jgi:PIN domain nuclease of toxin-antitoxin system
MTTPAAFLLDTCTVIYIGTDKPLKAGTKEVLDSAARSGALAVSAISALEIGISMSRGRIASSLPPLAFFNRFIGAAECEVLALSPELLIAASYLPGSVHGDPMDRIIIATARQHDLTIVTTDRAILAYGEAGHVKTLEC